VFNFYYLGGGSVSTLNGNLVGGSGSYNLHLLTSTKLRDLVDTNKISLGALTTEKHTQYRLPVSVQQYDTIYLGDIALRNYYI
ncbi:hypothetical protein, partial [Burkholderia sp. SIMBA_024]|uniref:hypothetical protein n=1 Tax=Burkholderia sp. SIMBA_024 TaxID=3085768 RepID=UPI00397C45BD